MKQIDIVNELVSMVIIEIERLGNLCNIEAIDKMATLRIIGAILIAKSLVFCKESESIDRSLNGLFDEIKKLTINIQKEREKSNDPRTEN